MSTALAHRQIADAVLLLHLGVVLFVVGGLVPAPSAGERWQQVLPQALADLIKAIPPAVLGSDSTRGGRDVLLKPGRLDEQEFEIMKTHVTHGVDIVARSAWLRDAGEVIIGHHEKFAGRGYHRGLQSHAIPRTTARIFAIAYVFAALTSKRPYKRPMTVEESIAILQQGAGRHFDPGLVLRFDVAGRQATAWTPATFDQSAASD